MDFSLAGILVAIASGMLAKAGEDSFDKLKGFIQYRLSGSDTAKALAAGETLDPKQVTIDVAAIESEPEVENIRAQIEVAVQQNEELKELFLAAQKSQVQKNIQINRDQSKGYQTNVSKDGVAYVADNITIHNNGH